MSKLNLTTRRANSALAPLIRHAARHPGSIRRIAETLSQKLGRKQHAANVWQWLHPDPEKRVEPRLGMGLVLVEMFQKGEFSEQKINSKFTIDGNRDSDKLEASKGQ